MAGYVEKEIVAAQKTVADAIAGKQLKAAIKQLQDRSQVKDSLKTLPARGAITAKRSIGKRASGGSTLTAYAETGRTFYTTARELRSSDGLFVLQYYNVKTITMTDN